MQHSRFRIFNGQIILPGGIRPKGFVLIEDGKIIAAGEGDREFDDAVAIDAKGDYISPGFIDIHVHGGGDHDFMDGNEEAFHRVAELHAKHGTTSILATTLTGTREEILNTLSIYESALANNTRGAQFIGVHLEGPYLAMSQRGAQDPRYIRDPLPEEYEQILAHSKHIKRWSAAPELPGAMQFGKRLQSVGILPSVAHTDALYEHVVEAIRNGYTMATHLYSAMSGVTRRNAMRFAGVIESALLMDEMDVEIIADGVHLPEALLKLVYKIKGADRIAIITDAMRGAGMPEGISVLGNRETGLQVIIEDGVAKLPDRSSFAGSVATADRLVRTMTQVAGVSLHDTIRMITETPARIMKIAETKGKLQKGMDADLVIFDSNVQVNITMVRGRIVYQK